MAISEQWVYAQQSILGSVLISPECAGKIVFGVDSDDFTYAYRTIYNAIRELYTTGKAVDPVTVLDKAGGGKELRELIAQLMEVTPTAANIDAYIEICRNCSRVHKYQEMGASLQAVETAVEAEELLQSAHQVTAGRGMASWTLSEAMHDFFQRYSKKVEYLPWFLPQLDPRLSMEFGDFCLLGGRPSSGKSAFALEAAVYWGVVKGYRVGFYSHETSREKLTNRMVAACARVPLDSVKHGTLREAQLQDVCDVASRISQAPIDLISCAGKTVAEMQAFALARRHQIVIVDYLQIVAGPGKDEYSQVSAISKSLHIMCQSLGIFCLALCQLSRTRGARPALEDLRSSGQLEQDADSVLFLHKQDGKDTEREFIIAKNKEGECRTTKLHFDGPIQHFSYLGPGEKPLIGYDYRRRPGCKQPNEELEQLPMDTPVPFDK
jgi:replicative DNA helicase